MLGSPMRKLYVVETRPLPLTCSCTPYVVYDEPNPMRRRTSAPPDGRYPPTSRPTMRTVPPQGTRRGVTRTSFTIPGTSTCTRAEVAGSSVPVPGNMASTSLEGPAGSFADQLPSPAVVVTAVWLNSPSPLSG